MGLYFADTLLGKVTVYLDPQTTLKQRGVPPHTVHPIVSLLEFLAVSDKCLFGARPFE